MKISLRDKKISQWNIILFLRDKIISPWNMKIQYFLMWFKNGAEGTKAPSPGCMGKNGLLKTMGKKGRDIKKPCKRYLVAVLLQGIFIL